VSSASETGWLPDCVYTGEKFESGLAFFADGLGRITRFSRTPADLAAAKRLPGQAALPGLVNGCAQSFPRALRGRSEARTRSPGAVPGRAEGVGQLAGRLPDEDLYDVARMAFLEMMLSGITCASEFHVLQRRPDGTAAPDPNPAAQEILRAAHDLGLRLALINVAYARSGFRQPDNPAESRWASGPLAQFLSATDRLREFAGAHYPADEAWVGVAPHSLRTVPLDYLKGIAAYAHTHRLRFFAPVSEATEDNEACVAEHGCRPVKLLADQGMLGKRFTALHAAQIDEEEARLIGAARATVCVCPAPGRHPVPPLAPIDLLRAEGAEIAIGSGGYAQFNLLASARLLDAQGPSGRPARPAPTAAVWFHALTVAGARSLGAPGGALEVGRPADFFTVNLFDPSIAGADPATLLAHVIYSLERRAIRDVWIGARPRLSNGRHPLQGAIIGRFAELQQRLWPVESS
jgi:formimidoylglutamate deiminase